MDFEILYQPKNLTYAEFQQVEQRCFPENPLNAERFAEMLSQNFLEVFPLIILLDMAISFSNPMLPGSIALLFLKNFAEKALERPLWKP